MVMIAPSPASEGRRVLSANQSASKPLVRCKMCSRCPLSSANSTANWVASNAVMSSLHSACAAISVLFL